MKQNYFLLIVVLILMSCNDVKTNKTLNELTSKTEAYNSFRLTIFKNELLTLANTAKLDDTFKGKYEIVIKFDSLTENYFNFLDSLKSKVVYAELFDKKEKHPYFLQNEFFKEKSISEKGQQFLDSINLFNKSLGQLLEPEFLETKILVDSLLSTKPIKISSTQEEEWLSYQFKGVTNDAAIANLTLMQSAIATIKSQLMKSIMGDEQFSASAYKVDVVLEKTNYSPGDKIRGKLFINKSAENLQPKEAVLNGEKIDKKYFKNGEVEIEMEAPKAEGDYPIEGRLTISQGNLDLTLFFNKSYTVTSKPKIDKVEESNTIADKNANSKVKKGTSNNKIVAVPKNNSLTNLEKPVIIIRNITAGSDGIIKLTRSNFITSSIDVMIPNSDLVVVVSEFSFKPSDQPTQKIYGNQLSSNASSIITKSKRGRQFKIFNLKISLKSNPSFRLKMPEAVTVELID